MLLNKNPCHTVHISSTVLLLNPTYRLHIIAHIMPSSQSSRPNVGHWHSKMNYLIDKKNLLSIVKKTIKTSNSPSFKHKKPFVVKIFNI